MTLGVTLRSFSCRLGSAREGLSNGVRVVCGDVQPQVWRLGGKAFWNVAQSSCWLADESDLARECIEKSGPRFNVTHIRCMSEYLLMWIASDLDDAQVRPHASIRDAAAATSEQTIQRPGGRGLEPGSRAASAGAIH